FLAGDTISALIAQRTVVLDRRQLPSTDFCKEAWIGGEPSFLAVAKWHAGGVQGNQVTESLDREEVVPAEGFLCMVSTHPPFARNLGLPRVMKLHSRHALGLLAVGPASVLRGQIP